ncbi:MAG: carboxypeptidase-like regulatory domain-containing protein [Candidatus Acidiferrales bacterium]
MTNRARSGLSSFTVCIVAVLCLLLSALVTSLAGVSANQNGVAGQEGGAIVSGHVYRADTGAPMAGTLVTLSPCYVNGVGWDERATSAADGSYTISARQFCYSATASSLGFVPQDYVTALSPMPKIFNLTSGDKLENIDFHLRVAAVISGSVSDAKGQPVAKISVSAKRLRFSPGGESHLSMVQSVMTDGAGRFRLDALAQGDYFVCADGSHGELGPNNPSPGVTYRQTCSPSALSPEKAQQVRAITGQETRGIQVQVAADKAYSIFVEVQDPEAGTMRRMYIPTLRPAGMSSSQGHGNLITIPWIFPGTYTLSIAAREVGQQDAVGEGSQMVQIVDSDVHVTVPIGKPGEVRGRVALQTTGVAFSDLQLALRSTLALARSSINANGNFDFLHVVPERQTFALFDRSKKAYLKQVRCSGQDYTAEPLPIESGQVVSDCDVTIATDAGVISGTASNDGKPAAGVTVVLIPRSPEQRKIPLYTQNAMTDAAGHFQVEGVIPGDYFLFAVPFDIDAPYYALDFVDRNQSRAKSVTVRPNQTQVVELKPTTP